MGSRRVSAMEQYFNEFVPMLEDVIKGTDHLEDDDPTIDLERMQVARREPVRVEQQPRPKQQHNQQHQQQRQQQQQQQQQQQHQQQQQKQHQQLRQTEPKQKSAGADQTFDLAKGKSCSLDELYVITDHLKKKSSYGDKLIAIMLDGLEKSIPPYFYRGIIEYGPPSDWLPIVKRNNEDTPYVEFLIKNVKSDEEPFSQIADYSIEHLALSKFVMDQLLSGARQSNQQNQPPSSRQIEQAATRSIKSSQIAQPRSQSLPQTPQSQKQQTHQHRQQPQLHQPQHQSRQRVLASDLTSKRSSLPPMTCSTPIPQRQAAVAKRASTIPIPTLSDDSLNDSKRILPPRACKRANMTLGIYKN